MRTCNNCQNQTPLFFCPKCGTILEYPDYIKNDTDAKAALAEYVKEVVKKAENIHKDVTELIDRTNLSELMYRCYYEHVAFMEGVCKSVNEANRYLGSNGSNLYEKMHIFGENCVKNECQIAVVGTIKAGKSALINAILGREIASTHPTPETASITKFRSSPSGNVIKVTFYNEEEWKELWDSVMLATKESIRSDKDNFIAEYEALQAEKIKDSYIGQQPQEFRPNDLDELKQLIDRFTSAKYADHYFAKEVEVGLEEFNVPKNIVFVDTPGLNDPVTYRSNITRHYLHAANVVLLCVKASSAELRYNELEEIASLFAELRYSKDRIYLFGTQIDMQPNFQDYWQKHTKPEFVKYLSHENYFGSKEEAEAHILPVTAWYYNMIRSAADNPELWSDKEQNKLLKELVNRCWDVKSLEDLIEEYGNSVEALSHYHSPKEIFYAHMEELEKMTYVPQMKQVLLEGPMKEAEKIIMNDIKHDYVFICNQISETAKDVVSANDNLIKVSYSEDYYKQIQMLRKQIAEENKNYVRNKTKLKDALEDMREKTQLMIENVKSEN